VIAQETSVPDAAGGATVAAVVVLAAGQGTRMRSSTPKVLHPLGGRSMLGHVLAAAEPLGAEATVVVVGAGRSAVEEHLARIAPGALPVVQEEQRGSGHAAAVALAAVPDLEGPVLLVNGDAPLLRAATVAELVDTHRRTGSTLTVLTAEVDDPTGLGRIVRGADGGVQAIVEESDATDEQRAIREINAGVYVADADALRRSLARIGADNEQGEQYFTDVLGLLVAEGAPVGGVIAADPDDVLGCNDRRELAARRRTLNDRVLDDLMRAGVTVVDPQTTWVDVTATVEPDAVLEPGTRLGTKAKIGAFVETKNADIGAGSKVPHLSYVGDATIGQGTNIGAATVFVNYDGVAKHHTTIGDHARTGADNMFVAPVTVGDGAYTAAGSVITSDVPPGAMAIARAPQRNVGGWVRRRRPGTPAAEAAEAAERRAEAAAEGRSETPATDHEQ
jgi:bifunctional UDP-N-acetylglucosamine pyrophosphorylase/glucosamine-1-phosphate N-acetyltransferase